MTTKNRVAILLAAFVSIGWFATGLADEVDSWQQTATLAAPEAVQAAAADEHCLYAIANSRIAKYDRVTGRRLSESTGTATHLNSGFLHEGKLYCAHSNYPKQPERSEILVLDRDSMVLSTFKEFGNFGGSLTWAVFHEGSWWCNFALYGDRNGETFLVRFDEQWQETGRWTYPPEVLQQIGRHSLSGGVWRNGELLVTGHDDPIAFRVRVPQAGNTLEFAGSQSVPFSGQGIAHDPVTGGLVGIRRAEKTIVLASPR